MLKNILWNNFKDNYKVIENLILYILFHKNKIKLIITQTTKLIIKQILNCNLVIYFHKNNIM